MASDFFEPISFSVRNVGCGGRIWTVSRKLCLLALLRYPKSSVAPARRCRFWPLRQRLLPSSRTASGCKRCPGNPSVVGSKYISVIKTKHPPNGECFILVAGAGFEPFRANFVCLHSCGAQNRRSLLLVAADFDRCANVCSLHLALRAVASVAPGTRRSSVQNISW